MSQDVVVKLKAFGPPGTLPDRIKGQALALAVLAAPLVAAGCAPYTDMPPAPPAAPPQAYSAPVLPPYEPQAITPPVSSPPDPSSLDQPAPVAPRPRPHRRRAPVEDQAAALPMSPAATPSSVPDFTPSPGPAGNCPPGSWWRWCHLWN
jgi:hypothetical protein